MSGLGHALARRWDVPVRYVRAVSVLLTLQTVLAMVALVLVFVDEVSS